MPTYEYVCRSCGHLFEIVQSMRDDALTECPECGGELRKVFTPPAISFKGSGFYATDHGKKKTASSSGEKGEGESGTPDKKPDKKPDQKKDTKTGEPASGGKQEPSSSSSSSASPSSKEGSNS